MLGRQRLARTHQIRGGSLENDPTTVAPGARTHVAFTAPNRQAVQAFHAAGLDAGGRDNGAPGPRPDYSATYYAAFLIDPDGNIVEAVCYSN